VGAPDVPYSPGDLVLEYFSKSLVSLERLLLSLNVAQDPFLNLELKHSAVSKRTDHLILTVFRGDRRYAGDGRNWQGAIHVVESL